MSRASLSILPDDKQSFDFTIPESSLHMAKRKLCDSKGYDLETVALTSGNRKKAKTSKVKKSHEDNDLDLDRGLNLAIAKLDSPLLADYVAQKNKRFVPDLSPVELEGKYISGILTTVSFGPQWQMCKVMLKHRFRGSL